MCFVIQQQTSGKIRKGVLGLLNEKHVTKQYMLCNSLKKVKHSMKNDSCQDVSSSYFGSWD